MWLRTIWILWPSFIMAGVAESMFFTLIAPREIYLLGQPVEYSDFATYTIGFFLFWLLCAGSSYLTCLLQRNPNRPDAAEGLAANPQAPRRSAAAPD